MRVGALVLKKHRLGLEFFGFALAFKVFGFVGFETLRELRVLSFLRFTLGFRVCGFDWKFARV